MDKISLKKFFSTHTHTKILFLTTCLALIYYSWNINSWKFSFVGDEWPFYIFAKEIVMKNFLVNPFDFNGVYSQNTTLSSIYQALFLQLFGFSNFAWRLSNIVLIIPITIFFYKWMKKSFNPEIALFSTILLQCSFYLANFFKVGKNMPQALALLIICSYYSVVCAKHPSKKNFFILGILLGFSFYIYIGPIFPLIIWPFLLPLLAGKTIKQALRLSPFFILGYVSLLLPALLQLSSLGGPAGKTIIHMEFTDNTQILKNIFHNFLLFYKNYDYLFNQFVAGPYLDVVTIIFALLGTFIVIFHLRKSKYLFLLLAYISACVIIGFTSPYAYAPTTRGIFFLPFGAAFAGIALFYALKKIPNYFIIPILFLVLLLNFHLSQIGVFNISGYTGTALLIKSLQDAQINNIKQNNILLLSERNYFVYKDLNHMRQAYNLEKVPFYILRTSQFNCQHLYRAKVIIFDYDTRAINSYIQIHCPPDYNYSVEILNPSIAI